MLIRLLYYFDETFGRKCNATFDFTVEHPLHEIDLQRIRSKFRVPTPFQRPPKLPPRKPDVGSEVWNRKAEKFANYMLVFFRPRKGCRQR